MQYLNPTPRYDLDTLKMEEDLKAKIRAEYLETYKDRYSWIESYDADKDPVIIAYFGKYNQYEIMFMSTLGITRDSEFERLEFGMTYILTRPYHLLYAYKDSKFCTLEELYKEGKISIIAIREIKKLTKEYYEKTDPRLLEYY